VVEGGVFTSGDVRLVVEVGQKLRIGLIARETCRDSGESIEQPLIVLILFVVIFILVALLLPVVVVLMLGNGLLFVVAVDQVLQVLILLLELFFDFDVNEL
jgi:hypothetical protein